MIFLALLGCGSFGLTTPGGDAGEAEGLVIEGIDPAWGFPSDETVVTLSGVGLEGATSVEFGRSELAFTRVDDTLVVTAPALGFEAVIDVTVRGDAGEDTVEGGFTYASEEPEETDTDTDADTDSDADADGKIGGLVQLTLAQYACPTCYDPALPEVDVYAVAAFHAPTRDGWLDWLPAEGDCTVDPVSSAPTSAYLDAGEWMYLTSGSRAVALRAASDHVFASTGLAESDFVRNAGYDLSLSEGGSGLDAFDEVDALTTPQGFSSVAPSAILLTNPADAFSARIQKANAAFAWSPSGGGGSFVVELGVYDGRSGAPLGAVVCRGPDDGSLQVPSNKLASFPSGSLLVIGLHRYAIGTFDRPDNGSEVETLATMGVVGTGSLQ